MKEIYKEEGVSEVVGTILVLAITVALFATVFAYTQHIPPPSKTSQAVIYPSFSISNGHLYMNLTNKGGTSYLSNETYLIVNANGASHSFLLYDLTQKTNFGPGDTVYLNGSMYNINVLSGSSFYALLYSKQYNSIVWRSQNFIGNQLSILNVQVTPSPIIPEESFTVLVSVYTLSPSKSATIVNLTLSKYLNSTVTNGKPPTVVELPMSPYPSSGNIVEYFATYTAPVSISNNSWANITAYIKGSNGVNTYDNISLLGGLAFAPSLSIARNGIIPEYVRPEHGSIDPLTIIVQNNGPVGATFNMFIYDQYPNKTLAPIQNNYGLKKVDNEKVINQTFTVGSLSSTTINVAWLNVGGNNSTAGGNYLVIGINNITGLNKVKQPINPPNATYYIYIMPKILLVNDQGSISGTQEDVGSYYTTLLQYTSYQFKEVTVNSNQNVSLSGYDVVIWFTGNNSEGLSQTQQGDLKYFYNNGGRIFLISGTANSYTESNYYHNTKSNMIVNISNSAIRAMNITQLKNATAVNYPFMDPYFVDDPSFTWMQNDKYLFNITYNNNNYTIGDYSVGNNGGKIVTVGFEFARFLLYQQDYLANKIMMWLANISTLSGNQLVLSDISFSNTTPLFYQTVNVTFAITNLSPVNLTTTLEMLVNDNFYKYLNGITIPKDGGFTLVNVSWIAAPPGINIISGIVDPFHQISQIDYSLDTASSLVNTTVDVGFSTLVLYDYSSGNSRGTPGLNKTLSSIGAPFEWAYIKPGASTSIKGNLSIYFSHFNLIIIDFGNGNSGNSLMNSTLQYAILNYYSQKNANPSFPYSIIFMGNGTENAISGNSIAQKFGIEFFQSNIHLQGSGDDMYGMNYTYSNNYGFFGNNITNGYGLVVNASSSVGLYNVTDTLSSGYEQILSSAWSYGSSNGGPGIILNDSGFKVAVVPFRISSIWGLIQLHTSHFSPQNPSQDARSLFMLMLMGYAGYTINKAIPYVMSSTITFSSPVLMINRYYLVSANISNLGNKPTTAIVQAYDGSGMFSSETVTLPALSSVPVQFIWDPQYAALPSNPRELRIVVSYSTGESLSILNFTREGIKPTPVYVFYDNLSTGNNWHSYATVWAWVGVNAYSNTNNFYSVEPYSTEGIAATGQESNGYVIPEQSSDLFQYINYNYWGLIPNSISGGFSIGTSSAYVYTANGHNYWNYTYGYASVITTSLDIHNSKYAYLEFYALYKLALGGEGVAVFISPSGQGSGNWIWISPIQGYPGNVYDASLPSSWTKPTNSADLLPAFTTVSGGENFGWQHYVFNISQYTSDSSIWIRFVLIINGDGSGYYTGIYGNDFFYADDIKVIENSTTVGTGNSQGDLWSRENSGGFWFYNSSTMYPGEIDSVESVPISFVNLKNATLSFMTQYSIYARFAYANDPTDVPDGFRLYVGFLTSGGTVTWDQIDTRWAGEAGVETWQLASQIPSAYYQNVYAFHQTGQTISLTGFIGLTIFLKFEVNGDNSNYFDSKKSNSNGIFATEPTNSNYYADFTDVIITGTSYADLISVNAFWT